MKTYLSLSLSLLLPLSAFSQSSQDSTGLPGDNFSLQGALEMLKQSASPEEFEKAINTESNHVNNLDLNEDGEIDYVRVVDLVEKNVHVFVLQVPISDKENQDIAVIELEKTGDTTAVLQIVGDEDIYGEEMIIEPNGGEEGNDVKKGKGPYASEDPTNALIEVNVWHWPCVHYVYAPAYRPWVSPLALALLSGMVAPLETVHLACVASISSALSPLICCGSYTSCRSWLPDLQAIAIHVRHGASPPRCGCRSLSRQPDKDDGHRTKRCFGNCQKSYRKRPAGQLHYREENDREGVTR